MTFFIKTPVMLSFFSFFSEGDPLTDDKTYSTCDLSYVESETYQNLPAAVKNHEFPSPPPLAFYICGWSPNAYIKHNKANSDAHLGHCKVGQHGGLILNQNFILSL